MIKPTYPPEINRNLVLLSYVTGIKFLFSYTDFVHSNTVDKMPNTLVKVVIEERMMLSSPREKKEIKTSEPIGTVVKLGVG